MYGVPPQPPPPQQQGQHLPAGGRGSGPMSPPPPQPPMPQGQHYVGQPQPQPPFMGGPPMVQGTPGLDRPLAQQPPPPPGMMPPGQGRGAGPMGYPQQGAPGMRPPYPPQPPVQPGPGGARSHLASPPIPGPGQGQYSLPPAAHPHPNATPPRGPLSPPLAGGQPGVGIQGLPPGPPGFSAPPGLNAGPISPPVGPAYGPQSGQTGLEGAMQGMVLAGPSGVPDHAPAKTKRPARAYHQEITPMGDDHGFTPPAPAYAGQGGTGSGRSSPMPPRGPLSPPAGNDYSMHHSSQQQPHPYQNAPPASLHHPDRPAHLQRAAHQPMPVVPPGPSLGPESSIPQPPHSAGQRLQGPRNRVDPEQIPSPVFVSETDQQLFDNEPFFTCGKSQVPLSLTDFVAIDQGNANPRFMRLTTYQLPVSDDMAGAAQLPLGIVVQPFAELKKTGEEGEVPVVDFGELGPPRCKRCRGYVNPWVHFVEGGQKFICNLCGGSTEVMNEYFCNLDMSGRRMDHNQRAELCRGSIDFVVPKDYWVQSESSDPTAEPRVPAPLAYVFAIDVSWSGVKSGMLQEVVNGIKEVIYGPGEDAAGGGAGTEGEDGKVDLPRGLPKGARVCIMTFDRTVHFYNIKAGLEQAQMMVVPDLDDMFVPMAEGLLADPFESRPIIESLLDSLPGMFAETQVVEAALGGPVQAAFLTLKRLGGQVDVFLTSLPTAGPGALKHREDQKLWGTDKEKTLFAPNDPWYRQAAEECALAGIGINLFLFPAQYIDVASVGVLSGLTGGETFFHPRFSPVKDRLRLKAQIRRVLTREVGASVTMRIRCSNGLRVAEHFGSFFQRNVTDLEFGNLDSDKAVAAHVRHEGKLDEKVDAYFQCALLYTSSTGERRVRCHNLAVPVTSLLGNVFRSADMDTTITFLAKQYIAQAVQKSLRDVRATLTDTCVKILVAYRKHCAASTSPGQLILPESYKLFPIYALALMKTKALKGGHVASDVRTHYMRYIKSMGVAATILFLYPRMFAIHALPDDVGTLGDNGRLRLPRLMRTSYQRMEPHGAYVIDNGDVAILWLGNAVSPQVLRELFGVESADEIDVRMSALPELPTKLSKQVRAALEHYAGGEGKGMGRPLVIARQNKDGAEVEFANTLVEDQNNDAMSYVDYLCFVHKQIQTDLIGEKKDEGVDASSLWRGTW